MKYNDNNINVLIPMAGLGSRFQKVGYNLPKPLIEINGQPMILKALNSLDLDGQYFFVISKNEYTQRIKETILTVKPNSKFIEIDYTTEGPACSALLHKQNINNDNELVIVNCDQIMVWNSKHFLYNARMYDGAVVTYYNNTNKNSYAKLSNKGLVLEIKEKEVISNISLNGIHYWKKGSYFINSTEEMIAKQDRAINGEYYIGPSYNYMIKNKYNVGIYHIPNEYHHSVGVPEDLKKYLEYENSLYI
jgi:NDP-sugar pyrophosphorylase family protein